ENRHVSLIAHPTGRLIGKRNGYQLDVETLIEHAKVTGTALEINSNPNRLDLSASWVQMAYEQGVTIAINTDAHNFSMLDHMTYGVSTARKGWLKKEAVLNTWSLDNVKAFMKKNRKFVVNKKEHAVMNERIVDVLEFDKIKNQLKHHAATSIGKER